jgi:hypothetical protein
MMVGRKEALLTLQFPRRRLAHLIRHAKMLI